MLRFTEDWVGEKVMVLIGLALMNIDRVKTTTADCGTTKGATGQFTPIHAMSAEGADSTYWLVVWPIAADQ